MQKLVLFWACFPPFPELNEARRKFLYPDPELFSGCGPETQISLTAGILKDNPINIMA